MTPLARIKALADPARYRVYEHLVAAPLSPRQMAEILGTPSTRLYHHFAVLERAGLIARAGTQRKRGTIEQYFTAGSIASTRPAGRRTARRSCCRPSTPASCSRRSPSSTPPQARVARRVGRTT